MTPRPMYIFFHFAFISALGHYAYSYWANDDFDKFWNIGGTGNYRVGSITPVRETARGTKIFLLLGQQMTASFPDGTLQRRL